MARRSLLGQAPSPSCQAVEPRSLEPKLLNRPSNELTTMGGNSLSWGITRKCSDVKKPASGRDLRCVPEVLSERVYITVIGDCI